MTRHQKVPARRKKTRAKAVKARARGALVLRPKANGRVRDYPPEPYRAEPERLHYFRNIEKELPFSPVEALARKLKMSPSQFSARLLGISPSTMRRRREKNRLTLDESTKVSRFSELLDFALEVTEGNEDAARRWLSSPLVVLGGESALEHARTETGAEEVKQVIGRFYYGVYG